MLPARGAAPSLRRRASSSPRCLRSAPLRGGFGLAKPPSNNMGVSLCLMLSSWKTELAPFLFSLRPLRAYKTVCALQMASA